MGDSLSDSDKEDSISSLKCKVKPNFNVQEKIQELMALPSSPTYKKSSCLSFKQSQRNSGINRGVSHKIKKPKNAFKKAKEGRLNTSKKIVSRIKDVKMPPRLPTNRVPLNSGEKAKQHKLSSPGISLLDYSPGKEEGGRQSKFFTSRSQSGANVNISENIKLYSVNGEIKMKTKDKKSYEKKNIGRCIEIELEEGIAGASLYSPVNDIKRLESARQLSSSLNYKSPLKPTRFPSRSPSPRKITSGSPRRMTPRAKITSGSPRRMTPRASRMQQTNSPLVVESPRRSPRKAGVSLFSKDNEATWENENMSVLINSPKRGLNLGNINKKVGSPRNRKAPLIKQHHKNENEENELQDLESVFDEIDSSSSHEDQILTSILKENQTPEKALRTHRRSPRKHLSSPVKLPTSNLLNNIHTQPPKSPKNVKYFPIFEPQNSREVQRAMRKKEISTSLKQAKHFLTNKSDESQMVIDAGQKNFGATFCKGCGTLFEANDPEDVKNHREFHDNIFSSLKYTGWKNEDQVTNLDNLGGKVVRVTPNSGAHWWRKVNEVLVCVDADLGFSENGIRCKNTTTVFLYVLEKQIVGVLIAESIESAYKVIAHGENSNQSNKDLSKLICCSETPLRVAFGISRIWVLSTHRRQRIASKLVDAMRFNAIPYHYLKVDDFAFSDPTSFGMQFAENYTGKNDFLVYRRN